MEMVASGIELNGKVYHESGDFHVCLWDYKSRNEGRGNFVWVSVDDMTQDEIMEMMSDYGKEVTKETGELHEDVFISDTENLPGKSHDFDPTMPEDIARFFEVAKDSYLEIDAISAGVSCDIPLESIEDSFVYQTTDDDPWYDYAYHCVDEGLMGEVADNSLKNYIDYAAIGRDLSIEHTLDYVNGTYYIFTRNY